MNKPQLNKLIAIFLIGCLSGFLLCSRFYKNNTETNETTNKEQIVTRIIERKDGTKETVIVEDRTSKTYNRTPKVNNWSVMVGENMADKRPIYMVGVDRIILPNISIGAYARSDREYGAYLRYSF